MKTVLRKVTAVVSAIILSVCGLLYASCKKENGYYSAFCFDAEISVATFDGSLPDSVKRGIDEILYGLSGEFSLSGNGFLSRFNAAETGEEIAVSPLAFKVLEKMTAAHGISPAFNPAVLPFLRLWHFTPDTKVPNGDFVPPTADEITAVKNSNSFDPTAFSFNEEKTAVVKNEKISFDAGGIIKGVAVDEITELLKSKGYDSGYVNFGGSSISILSANSLSVTHPDDVSKNIIRVEKPENVFVSTSGNYRTYYEYDGVRYSHIIDAESGRPTNSGVTSAIVFGNSGWLTDATSTALMLLDKSGAENLIRTLVGNAEYGVLTVFVIINDGDEKTVLTNEKQGEFTLLDDSYSVSTVV
ncbi:MAG: FAD:protein FMN transferase [Clostridia bacterium]|nr:FAD:protein FMN transferase [Clostridia bacterium]